MHHVLLSKLFERAEIDKSDSDFTYFFSLLLAGEALTKLVVLGMLSAVGDDKDRNRYRLEHQLVRSDGIGDWATALEDVLTGLSSQYLLAEARVEQNELTRSCKIGEWQYQSVLELKLALEHLAIKSEDVPVKTDMKRWFRLFATLRNKTRAHGATQPSKARVAAEHLYLSLTIICSNFSLLQRPWAYLYRSLSGKYRVSAISPVATLFDFLKKKNDCVYQNGIYVFIGAPRLVPLLQSDPELQDFYFANGGFRSKSYELLSYCTDNKVDGDASAFLTPPGTLPPSETEGHGELIPRGNCFSNTPEPFRDYISREGLEDELRQLVLDDKRPIVTLVGRGGIGKTSLAIKVAHSLHEESRFTSIVWFSARDVDLQFSGPKEPRQNKLPNLALR